MKDPWLDDMMDWYLATDPFDEDDEEVEYQQLAPGEILVEIFYTEDEE